MNIRNELENQLTKPDHIVKVTDIVNNRRLKKNSNELRYAYSYNDIKNQFGSIDNFINFLIDQGFTETRFLIQKIYGTTQKITYHTMKDIVVTLDKNTMQVPKTPVPQLPKEEVQMSMQTPHATMLGNPTTGLGSLEFLGAYVQAERAKDYQKRVLELEEELRESRSKRRILEEENHSLKLKVATSEERAKLDVQTQLLEKRSFWESQGFEKISEGLGAVLPHLIQAAAKPETAGVATQLGAPDVSLTAMQQQAVEYIKNSDEKYATLFLYLMQNYSDELAEVLTNYVENQDNGSN